MTYGAGLAQPQGSGALQPSQPGPFFSPKETKTMSRFVIEVRMLRSGQPRAYSDSFYEAEIRFSNFWDSTTGEREGTWCPDESRAREIARLFVHGFNDAPNHRK